MLGSTDTPFSNREVSMGRSLPDPGPPQRDPHVQRRQDDVCHDVPGDKCTDHQVYCGDDVEDGYRRSAEMAYVEEYEPEEQCQEQQRVCAACPHCPNEEYGGDEGENDEESTDVDRRRLTDVVMSPQQDASDGHPERAV